MRWRIWETRERKKGENGGRKIGEIGGRKMGKREKRKKDGARDAGQGAGIGGKSAPGVPGIIAGGLISGELRGSVRFSV